MDLPEGALEEGEEGEGGGLGGQAGEMAAQTKAGCKAHARPRARRVRVGPGGVRVQEPRGFDAALRAGQPHLDLTKLRKPGMAARRRRRCR